MALKKTLSYEYINKISIFNESIVNSSCIVWVGVISYINLVVFDVNKWTLNCAAGCPHVRHMSCDVTTTSFVTFDHMTDQLTGHHQEKRGAW